MIMPGISGSMIMVLLGVYTSVLTAISSFNIPVLIPVALGVLLGVFWGAKLIDWCMKRFEQQTYFAILGLDCRLHPADSAQRRLHARAAHPAVADRPGCGRPPSPSG